MPTIAQLPAATSASSADAVPISQAGVVRSVSLGTMLSQTQPAIIVPSQVLLGRVSLGPGGPEAVTVGAGLSLSGATVSADGMDHADLPLQATLAATDKLVINSGGVPHQTSAANIRSLFSAGSYVAIDAAGVISATWPNTTSAPSGDIAGLPPAANVLSTDLIGISQAGTDHAISYSSFLNGLTIDQAQQAASAADSDAFWVAQDGNTMSRQTLSAVWAWISSKLPSVRLPVVEISVDTFLDATVHNGRVLVCSRPLTLSPLLANMGNGFHCEIINTSAGNVAFASGITLTNGSSILAAGQGASLRCVTFSGGTIVYAVVGGAWSTAANASVPGQPNGLTASSISASGVTLGWQPPTSGGTVGGYVVQYRVTGTEPWTVVSQSSTMNSYAASGLASGLSYDFAVAASNGSGTGVISEILTVATAGAPAVPGPPVGVTANASSNSAVTVSWSPPTNGGTPANYAVQYRPSGASSWTNIVNYGTGMTASITGLASATAYDFSVIASNAAGAGQPSVVVTASTPATAGNITAINWNLVPSGTYTSGDGAIGVNAHVTPANAAIRFGFSQSLSTAPAYWTDAILVNTDLWGAYVPTPTTAGSWYVWVEGTDGSMLTAYNSSFTVN